MASPVVILGPQPASRTVEAPEVVARKARIAARKAARRAALRRRPTRKRRVRDRGASFDRQQRRRDLLIIARKDFAFYQQGYLAAVEARREAAYRAQRAGLTDREIAHCLGVGRQYAGRLAADYLRTRTKRNKS